MPRLFFSFRFCFLLFRIQWLLFLRRLLFCTRLGESVAQSERWELALESSTITVTDQVLCLLHLSVGWEYEPSSPAGKMCTDTHVKEPVLHVRVRWKTRTHARTHTRNKNNHHTLIVSVFTCRSFHSSGAVWESRWPSWAVRLNEPSGFRGRKAILNHASALVTACP